MKKTVISILLVLAGFAGFAQFDLGLFVGAHSSLNHRKIISPSVKYGSGKHIPATGYTAGVRFSYPISAYFVLANETAFLRSSFKLKSGISQFDYNYLNSYIVLDFFPFAGSSHRFIQGLSINTGVGVTHLLWINKRQLDTYYIPRTGPTIKTGLRLQKYRWDINLYLDRPLNPFERPPKYGDFQFETYFRNLGMSIGYRF